MELDAAGAKNKLTKRVNSSLLDRIPAILDACRKAGVVTLKCGELEVSFASPEIITNELGAASQAPLSTPAQTIAQQASGEATLEPIDRELLEEMRQSQLLIEDPLAFEQEVIDRHLREAPAHGRDAKADN